MKKGRVRTVKKFQTVDGKKRILYAIEVKVNNTWRQATDDQRRKLIFQNEYDACAKLLSAFERSVL